MKLKKGSRGKILWVSDSPFTNTGYSSQSLFLLNALSKLGWDIHFLAHNYYGQILPKGCVKLADGTPFDFTLYPNGKEPYGKDVVTNLVRELKPDYTFYLLDTFMVYPWFLQLDFAPSISGFWFPSDGGRFPTGCENILRKVNIPIAMSMFGKNQLKDYHDIDVHHIPHGVDSEVFKPYTKEEKLELKKVKGLKDKYVVGLMGRNQGRKMHDRALKMFREFCKDVPEAVLLLHLDPSDGAMVFDIQKLVVEYGIENRVLYTGTKYYKGFTYEEMREVYGVMDVYLSSTSGEGFGVGTIEAMSVGVPVLNTLYTTTEELVVNNNAGEGIKLVGCEQTLFKDSDVRNFDFDVVNGTITGTWNVERGLADVGDGASKLRKLYLDSGLSLEYGSNGRKAVLEKYDWPVIVEQWDELLREVLK
jgi:glycosyltransferase involved in cell wall biosynthesis